MINITLLFFLITILFIYNKNLLIKNNKFFKIDLSTIYAGLSHQTSNFKSIIAFCYYNNLKLIKPKFNLIKKHNNNKGIQGTDLSKYYNLDNITFNGKLFKLYDDNNDIEYTIKKNKYKNGVLKFDKLFRYVSNSEEVNIPYNKNITFMALRVTIRLNNYMCIHVRRGDRIKNNKMDIDTQPNNIKNKIEKYHPESVYIMTNKIDELKYLLNFKNIYFYKDFSFLKNITDNYYLFCIENEIMRFAKIRCSTFKTNRKYLNSNYYHCNLTNTHGFQ